MTGCPLWGMAGSASVYEDACMEKQFTVMKTKYFKFDGNKMISLWFFDTGNCWDNSGVINVELRKVINFCPDIN